MATNNVPIPFHELVVQYFYILPIISFVSYVIYQRYFSSLAGIPGPFWASLTRWWHVWTSKNPRYTRYMIDLHAKYGPLVRVGPDEVSISDVHAIKTIYGGGSKFRKSDWYSVWQGHRVFDLFAGRDEKIHGAHRRLVARAYSMDAMRDLEPYVDGAIEVFMRRMNDIRDKSVDLGNWLQLFAFDVIGEVTFSKSFGFMEAGQDDGTFGALYKIQRSGAWLGHVPWVFWLNDFLTPMLGNHLDLNIRHGKARTFASNETAARRERPSERKDIVGRLFVTHAEKPNELDYNGIVSMATSNVVAGSDTTAISARAVVYYLLKYPETKKKLIEEIDGLRKQGKISDPVQFTEANNMPYLQACLYEGMRIHPSVGSNLPRVVPPGGAELAGHFIPAGKVVGVNAWVAHRNEEIFGEQPEVFRPERWLKEDTGDMQRCFLSFGAGSRSCIGRNISWLELSKLIPTLFLRYNVELTEPDKEWKEIFQLFVVQEGLNVQLTPRVPVAVAPEV